MYKSGVLVAVSPAMALTTGAFVFLSSGYTGPVDQVGIYLNAGVGYFAIDDVSFTAQPSNSCTGANIDAGQSNGQLSVSYSGGCDGLLTLRNTKNYWTNFQLSTTGSVSAAPVAGDSNAYAAAGLLPPSGLVGSGTQIMYYIHFTHRGESVSIYVDPTGQTGNGLARYMNLVQIILNAAPLGSAPTLVISNYQLVAQAFAQMPHLNSAAGFLFSNPLNFTSFLKELGLFFTSLDELATLANVVEALATSNGIAFAKAGFLSTLQKLVGWPIRIVNATIQAFGNVYSFAFRYPTGSVILSAQ